MQKYGILTKHLPAFETKDARKMSKFIEDIYSFVNAHPEYNLKNYEHILEENDIKWALVDMQNADVSALDEKAVLALLIGAVRAGYWDDDAWHTLIEEGQIHKWLTKLKELDKE